MIICPNCNKQINQNSRFCGYCGQKIEDEKPADNDKGYKNFLIRKKLLLGIFSIAGVMVVSIIAFITYNQLKHKIEERKWEKIKNSESIELIDKYIRENGKSKYFTKAEELKKDWIHVRESTIWEQVKKKNRIEEYNKYLKEYPQTRFRGEAFQLIGDLEWQNINKDSISELDKFIKQYPSSNYCSTATQLLAKFLNVQIRLQDFLGHYGKNLQFIESEGNFYLINSEDFSDKYLMKELLHWENGIMYQFGMYCKDYSTGENGLHYYSFGKDNKGNYVSILAAYRNRHTEKLYRNQVLSNKSNLTINSTKEVNLNYSNGDVIATLVKNSDNLLPLDANYEVNVSEPFITFSINELTGVVTKKQDEIENLRISTKTFDGQKHIEKYRIDKNSHVYCIDNFGYILLIHNNKGSDGMSDRTYPFQAFIFDVEGILESYSLEAYGIIMD